ncbi:MAG: GNAT family N-acetyltransferase [Gammaproteobacteria bacterium]|nr:GNAT family N-acetyltransferase [Gammaproteobacteria bacterium]
MVGTWKDVEFIEGDRGAGQLLETELLASLRNCLPQAENSHFVLAAQDPHGRLLGGVSATTSYGWLLVKTLWVHSDYRRSGLGRALMARAERKGVETGCHGAWLDTSNPAAMQFYLQLGYVTFGKLTNRKDQPPDDHTRWFLKKAL